MKMTPEQIAARDKKLIKKYGSLEAFYALRQKKLVEKYGEEGLAKKRKEWQAKSRKNYKGNGGFRAIDPERRKAIASSGGKAYWEKYGNKLKKVYEADN